jgi:hypothetical protein
LNNDSVHTKPSLSNRAKLLIVLHVGVLRGVQVVPTVNRGAYQYININPFDALIERHGLFGDTADLMPQIRFFVQT